MKMFQIIITINNWCLMKIYKEKNNTDTITKLISTNTFNFEEYKICIYIELLLYFNISQVFRPLY